MVKDEDDQDPSFNYQGCTVQDGACINPEYHTTVSNHYINIVHTPVNIMQKFEHDIGMKQNAIRVNLVY